MLQLIFAFLNFTWLKGKNETILLLLADNLLATGQSSTVTTTEQRDLYKDFAHAAALCAQSASLEKGISQEQ